MLNNGHRVSNGVRSQRRSHDCSPAPPLKPSQIFVDSPRSSPSPCRVALLLRLLHFIARVVLPSDGVSCSVPSCVALAATIVGRPFWVLSEGIAVALPPRVLQLQGCREVLYAGI